MLKPGETPFYGKAVISSISESGLVLINFNESMQVPTNLSEFNTSNMDLYVKVSNERLAETDFNATKLNFTWEITEFTERNMSIQLNFTNPLAISPKIVQDELVVYFRMVKLFSKEGK